MAEENSDVGHSVSAFDVICSADKKSVYEPLLSEAPQQQVTKMI